VRCTETRPRPWPCAIVWGAIVLAGLSGCAQRSAPGAAPGRVPGAPAAAAVPASVPPAPATAAGRVQPLPPLASAKTPSPAVPVARGPMPRNPRYVTLLPPLAPRSEAALRVQFAQRLVAAHPDGSYTARTPDRLLAIPVLEVELNADGSVRDIKVLRRPSTGNEATALAIAAVRRAAPYGNVSRLPRPWKVVETFLFDDDLRFKPRTLDFD